MAKVIDRGDISLHQADALLFGDPEDLGNEAMDALDARYGKDAEGQSLLRMWAAYLASQPGWGPGIIAPNKLGPKEDQLVIFCCVRKAGEPPEYMHVRDSMLKVVEKAKDLGVKHVVTGVLGRGHGNVKVAALDPVISSAVGKTLMVDIYDEFEKGKVPV